jgi:hypothetical protein
MNPFANMSGLSESGAGISKVKAWVADGNGVPRATYIERDVLPGGEDSPVAPLPSLNRD